MKLYVFLCLAVSMSVVLAPGRPKPTNRRQPLPGRTNNERIRARSEETKQLAKLKRLDAQSKQPAARKAAERAADTAAKVHIAASKRAESIRRRKHPYYHYHPQQSCGGCGKGCCDPPARIKRRMACAAGSAYSDHYWDATIMNLAYKRWAFKSSWPTFFPAYPRVTDGSRANWPWWQHCSLVSSLHEHPWIAVSLSRETCVETVTLTGPMSTGNSPILLKRFNIYVTSFFPNAGNAVLSTAGWPLSDRCDIAPLPHYAPPVFFTDEFPCNKVGRYVVIQNTDRKWLVLCEVEVKGRYAANNSCC